MFAISTYIIEGSEPPAIHSWHAPFGEPFIANRGGVVRKENPFAHAATPGLKVNAFAYRLVTLHPNSSRFAAEFDYVPRRVIMQFSAK